MSLHKARARASGKPAPKKRHKWTSRPGGDNVCVLCGMTQPRPFRSPVPPCEPKKAPRA